MTNLTVLESLNKNKDKITLLQKLQKKLPANVLDKYKSNKICLHEKLKKDLQ